MNILRWLYDSQTFVSPKNGLISCRRLMGRWKIRVGGIDQTSPYVTRLWREALRRIPKRTKIKTVLLLGMGAGGQIEIIHKRFPNASVTAVEHDPQMIEIGKKFHIFRAGHSPKIICDDAQKFLEETNDKFDLILFDLFTGREPAPLAGDLEFLENIARALEFRGCCIFNVFMRKEFLDEIDKFLSRWDCWTIHFNNVALYRHFGNGKAGDPLPRDFKHPRQSEKYIQSENLNPRLKIEVVGGEKCPGARWHYGPLWFEEYFGDEEPAIDSKKPRRLIFWQPISRLDKPKGWHRSWIQTNIRQTGFAEITNPENYWESWTDHARRHRQKWLREYVDYEIPEVDLDEFLSSYLAVPKPKFLRDFVVKKLKRKSEIHRNSLKLFAARKKMSGEIMAGLATVDLPEISQSMHLASFIKPEAEKTSVGVGLIDHWFKYCINQKIRFLNFGTFWAPGDPKDWKGFSRFKSQFGVRFVRYPNPLIRIK